MGIGRRGVSGIKALGSVSERVVHRAPCSVLVMPARDGSP
ncbi:MAG: universal stress protein [Syntrophothermus sp.]